MESTSTDGGLAAWRESEAGQKRELPTILFPAQDLLLLGHTKQMHLFEPRWVDMIDTARSRYGGVFALVYVVASGGTQTILRIATVVEVTACNNLGTAGRVVTARGVARAVIEGISVGKSVGPDSWGLATVEEVPEIRAEDLELSEEAGKELRLLLADLDLSGPGRDAGGQTGQTAADDDEPADELDGPELWTHERESPDENFTAQWDERIADVERTLAGVPLPLEGGVPAAAWPGMVPGVALLYAALSAADIMMRVEVFGSPDQSLTARLRDLLSKLDEKQGMARARRAIASALDDEEGGSPDPAPIPPGPRDPKLGFLGRYEQPGRYAFRVGDIVVHRGHGQVGVVAERFRVCQLSEEWHAANAPPGLTAWQPFYTILVSMPGQSFSRHGAQSSHRRWDAALDGGEPPPVQHPDVGRFFSDFDPSAARYWPLDEAAAAQEVSAPEWDKAE